MATGSELVNQAFREGNLVPLGTTLTSAQEVEGLLLLNRFQDSLLGYEFGEFAMDWPIPPSVTAPVNARYPLLPYPQQVQANVWPYPPCNVRLLLNLTADQTVYLPQAPSDGARIKIVNVGGAGSEELTIDGNGRLVTGSATLAGTPTDLDGTLLFYRADLANWISIVDITADGESQLPSEYDDLLAIGTFIRIAPRYGRKVDSEEASTFKRLLKRAKTQYRQSYGVPAATPQPFITPLSGAQRSSVYTGE